VGIGTTSPYATLSIKDAGNSTVTSLAIDNHFRFSGDGVLRWGQLADAGILSWNTGVAIVGSQTNNDLTFTRRQLVRKNENYNHRQHRYWDHLTICKVFGCSTRH